MADGIASGIVKPDAEVLAEVLILTIGELISQQRALTKRIADLERRQAPPAKTRKPSLTVIEPGPFAS
jgi:hypothetical protein